MEHDDVIVRVVTIVVLGVILTASIVSLTVVAVRTDRRLDLAQSLTFGGVVVLAALGGVSWTALRRRRSWRVSVGRDDKDEDDDDDD